MKKRLLAVLAALALAGPARAAFEDLGAGARAPGMGNAFTATADDAYSVYYNPAGLSLLERPQFGTSYSRLHAGLTDGSDITLSDLTYGHPLGKGRGTLGAGWQRLSLGGLYAADSLLFSYGRTAHEGESGSALMLGGSLKYLRHAFIPQSTASNACAGLSCNQGADPVLSGRRSSGAPDADLGAIYRLPSRLQLGLMATHLLRPDVGFSGSERLPVNWRTGVSYKTLWMDVAGELRLERAPDGKLDENFIAGAERYFPTLAYGQFGLRGSLGFGSREWRQVTAGLSYRVGKVQFDYALLMPFGGLSGTNGTHRLGITFHFGAPRAVDEYSADILESIRRSSRPLNEGYAYEFEPLKRLPPSEAVLAAMIRSAIEQGRYETALRYLSELAGARGPRIEDLKKRLALVAAPIPAMTDPKEKWERVATQGIREWLDSKDAMAVKRLAYAYSLRPSEPALAALLDAVEKAAGLKGERVSARFSGEISLVDEKLLESAVTLRQKRYGETMGLLKDVLELEPTNATALARLGTAHYLQGKREKAIAAWTVALHFEEEPEIRDRLRAAIAMAEGEAAGKAPAAEPAAPEPPPEAAPAAADPRLIESLYREGVERYAAGDKERAAQIFRRILELDPDNEQARGALKRLKREP